HL
ncbi:methyl-accepting chemotaxis (MCP) signaling domain protein, partial [Vibrio parahaemolyticus SBR10290]